jgi:hypothetical protein
VVTGERKVRWRARIAALALLSVGVAACGTILGIGDPTLESEGGVNSDGGKDSTSGGGMVGRDGRADAPLEAGEEASADATEDTLSDGGGFGDGGFGDGDAAEACPMGQTACGNGCIDTSMDLNNCGSCGNMCPATQSCVGGFCVCPTAGQLLCPSGCVDPTTDPNNCMTCGTTCIQGQSCVGGACVCPTGQSLCALAEAGAPEGGSDAGDAGSDAAVRVTPAYCADFDNDPTNCNGCGITCVAKNDVPGCSGGICTVGTCETNFADCNHIASDGCEIYTPNDNANCGQCNNPCGPGELCSNGNCVFTCPGGQTVCHTIPPDGGVADAGPDARAPDAGASSTAYCSTLPTDPQNCGACNNDCNSHCVGEVASTSCTASTCEVATCASGYFDLDGLCANGCECKSLLNGPCAAPVSLGTMTVGQQISTSSNLVPAGKDTYYEVTFTGYTSSAYHPKITFALNPNNEFVFDVQTNCSSSSVLGCGDISGGSKGLSTWEVVYASGLDFGDYNFNYIAPLPAVYIHVYRATGAPVDCDEFSLVINN